MVKFKTNLLEALKNAGYTTYRLRKEAIFGEATIKRLRFGDPKITLETLDRLCGLLHCQPGDLLEYVEDDAGDQAADR